MQKERAIFWFRQDLRLSDNPGLLAALKEHQVLPIYILDGEGRAVGGASKWWLHNSLEALNNSLGGNLNFYSGNAHEILLYLVEKYAIKEIYWNRCYEQWRVNADTEIKKLFTKAGIACHSYNASLLWEPWQITKSDGSSYKVFTPFYRNGCASASPPRCPLPAPTSYNLIKDDAALALEHLKLLPKMKWYNSMEDFWQIGETAAQKRLHDFINNGLRGYKEGRNYPDKQNTSRLSPHLHFGEISPHQVWHAIEAANLYTDGISEDVDHFKSELGWREFSYYLYYHFPDFSWKNFQAKFDNFPWQDNEELLHIWRSGKTGYPIVDAGMRELWQTGFMHNRVRMIVASFLVKNLLVHWRHGEEWFWDCLVDANAPCNSASWQWVAGSGADAAPYFRIFNPILQAKKFDPQGNYIRKFLPELSRLPTKYLFAPEEAPTEILKACGIELGKTYPRPIVDINKSRQAALKAYEVINKLL